MENKDKKYELTNETIEYNGITLYRIRALKSFGLVDKGDLGGYIQSERNLSHEGTCWVYNKAKVFDNAKVYDNAEVSWNVMVYGNAEVFGDADICDDAEVFDNAKVYGEAMVYGNTKVYERAEICGETTLMACDEAYNLVCGDTKLC